MSQLPEPPYATYEVETKGDGLTPDFNAHCIPCLHLGTDNGQKLVVVHRTADYTSVLTVRADEARYVTQSRMFDATWYGIYNALRNGAISMVGTYRVHNRPNKPIVEPASQPDEKYRALAAVRVLGPAIYNVEDRGSAACPNGQAGRALHLWSRDRDPNHQLSDVTVETNSMRFCSVRLALNGPGALGGNVLLEEHLGDVGGNWMVTDGAVEGTVRALGVSVAHGVWRYRFTHVQFPKYLPLEAFSPRAVQKQSFDPRPYLQPQTMVDVGGRRLNLYCTGSGSPTVLLDAGGGSDMLDWAFVQPLVSSKTRVCSYDRAGMGFSDPAPIPRDATAQVSDLHALVARAPILKPFVLVGYSSSTMAARLYADRFPDELAALVLVEPAIEDHLAGLLKAAPALSPYFAQGEAMRSACTHAEDHAVLQLSSELYSLCVPAYGDLPGPLADARTKEFLRPLAWKDVFSEAASDETSSPREIDAGQRSYAALPLVLLTAADAFPTGDYLPQDQRRSEIAYIDALRAPLLSYSTTSSHVVVANCSHGDIAKFCASDVASAILKAALQQKQR